MTAHRPPLTEVPEQRPRAGTPVGWLEAGWLVASIPAWNHGFSSFSTILTMV